jgi:hypothetical protein
MTRTIIVCYDHSPSSRNAIKWAVAKNIFLSDDTVILTTALDEDVAAIEGGSLAIPNVAWSTGDFIAADYAERVHKMEKEAECELKLAVDNIRTHVVNAR